LLFGVDLQFHLLRDMLLAWLKYAREAKAARSSEAGERKATLFYEAGIAARTFVAWSEVVKKRMRARNTTKLVMLLRENVSERSELCYVRCFSMATSTELIA
jgi:hypothetical protein